MRLTPILLVVLFVQGCGGHRVVHTAPDESQPHITWEIRTGGEEGEERLACEAGQPQPQCELSASSTDRREMTTIHVYMHAASQVAIYEGSLRISFLGTSAESERLISTTVNPGDPASSLTVFGVTTNKPGTYAMSVSLKVTHGGKDAGQLSRDIKVIVR